MALEQSDANIELVKSNLDAAYTQIHELSAERDAMDLVLQETTRTAAQNESNFRAQLKSSLAEIANLRDGGIAEKGDTVNHLQLELKKTRAELERLDSENAFAELTTVSFCQLICLRSG